ncbi:hypothetical protein CBR_g276 [Chara braunii]|uniref:LRAT domain-containing protein n=1 Tax=Chara braunii TaxID=69332 RepID=A0A388JM52_CHABU|nr:hypothetical protein CBR_g276 [Chara braunii]|eukprot:GBG58877.1 hypothetical protein CBR_g276 [Chara braunii]
MTILSNRIQSKDLVPGDHIYTWRACYGYTYHGIYEGNDSVIFFYSYMHDMQAFLEHVEAECTALALGTDDMTVVKDGSATELQPSSSLPLNPAGTEGVHSGNDQKDDSGKQMPELADFIAGTSGKVVKSTVTEFLNGGSLYRYQYGICPLTKILKLRGTCTEVQCDSSVEDVLHRARYLLHHPFGFGPYDLIHNNSEDFAIYCKTGLVFLPDMEAFSGRSGPSSGVRDCTELGSHTEEKADTSVTPHARKEDAMRSLHQSISECKSLSTSQLVAWYVLHTADDFVRRKDDKDAFGDHVMEGEAGDHRGGGGIMTTDILGTILSLVQTVERPGSVPARVIKLLMEIREQYLQLEEGYCEAEAMDTKCEGQVSEPIARDGQAHNMEKSRHVKESEVVQQQNDVPAGHSHIVAGDQDVKDNSGPFLPGPSLPTRHICKGFAKYLLSKTKEYLEREGGPARSSEAEAAISAITSLESSQSLLEAYCRYLCSKASDFSQKQGVHKMPVETMVEIISRSWAPRS